MPGRQRGIAILFYMIGMVAVIGMAGFALDLGMMMLTKTRLQNALDAAALDGAKELYLSGGDTGDAVAAAKATFAANLADGPTPTVAFSPTQSPFAPGGANPKFVLVTVDAMTVTTYLSRVVGVANSFNLNGAAMAGPMPMGGALCGAPLGICGSASSGDHDCADGNGCWGIAAGQIILHSGPTGPGNYGFLDMGHGASDVAKGMAGSKSLCLNDGSSAATQPGNQQDIRFATNTRFAQYKGSYDEDEYPGDVVTTAPLLYSAYKALLQNGSHDNPGGVGRRRTMLLPVVDCTGVSGASNVTVLGRACIFLRDKVPTSGPTSGTIFAEIIDECLAEGGTPDPDSESGAVQFMLFPATGQG